MRATAVAFAVLSVFSLGGTLLADGREHEGIVLPWHWLQTLPVAAAVIPDRFSIIADGAAAALLAFGLDAARSRWPGRGGLIAAAAVIALLPLVPRPLPAADASPVPAGWTAAFAALRLPPGADVLVVPIPVRTYTAPLRWQADTGVRSGMYGGYFMGPTWNGQPATDGNGLSSEADYLNQLWAQIVRRQRRGGRHPPGHRALPGRRADAGAAGRLEAGRRRRRHPPPAPRSPAT